MAVKTFEIASYEIDVFGNTLITYNNQAVPIYAIIRTHGKDGESFDVLITPEWSTLPPTSEITGSSVRGQIVAAPDRYSWFVDLIRNEGPILATVDNSTPMRNRLEAAAI